MRTLTFIMMFVLVNYIFCVSTFARPGEPIDNILEKYNLGSQQPVEQGDYISYKAVDTKFVSQPTIFFKLGAKGVILEQNFLFDKNTVHEKDVQRAKNDSKPTVDIPNHSYLVGDFSQLPREQFDARSRAIGAIAAPFGAAVGTIAGAGKGLYEGTRIGVGTANSASRALGGDASGRAGAWASSATAVATGAVTGLIAGFAGGAVEGSVQGSRVALEGLSGADRNITGITEVASDYVIIGGRIGKELTPDEQKSLLDELSTLEASRLAGRDSSAGDLAKLPGRDDTKSYIDDLDSAKDRGGFDEIDDSGYLAEDAENKNVAGMW